MSGKSPSAPYHHSGNCKYTEPTTLSMQESIRMQEIMMMQMVEEYERQKETLKFYVGPKKKTQKENEDRKECTEDFEGVQEMIEQLKIGVEETKKDFETYMAMKEEEDRLKNLEGPICDCE